MHGMMKNSYNFKNITNKAPIPWQNIEHAEIMNFPWDDNGYRPKAFAQACHTEDALHVKLTAFEHKLRAVYGAMNEPVYTDSCLEFFIIPDPENDSRYLNFEINPLGTLLLGLGSTRDGRILLEPEQAKLINISTYTKKAAEGREWGVELTVPYEFIRSIYPTFKPAAGKLMRGNFYKCGDETEFEHYGCWNPIALEKPDFHCPEFFGNFVLE